MSLILLKQIIIMFMLMLVGLVMTKKGHISQNSAKDMGALLVRVVIPCVILKSFFTKYSASKSTQIMISFALALISLAIAIVVSYMLYQNKQRVENFSAAFCNAGFIGIPLAQAAYGNDGVFYVSAYIALLNILQWTYGAYILTGDKKNINIKLIATNPVIVSLVIGLIIFRLNIPIPDVITKTVIYIAEMNSPLAMFILGVYMAQLSLRELFQDAGVYICSLIRLVLIPVVTLLIMWIIQRTVSVIGIRGMNTAGTMGMDIMMVTLIAASTPVGANIAVFARQFNENYLLSVKNVCMSTVMSIVTIPIFMSVAGKLLN